MRLYELAGAIQQNHDNYIEFYNKNDRIKKSYGDMYMDVIKVCGELKHMGIHSGDWVGVYARNSYEWVIIDLACFISDYILVAFPENFTIEQIGKYAVDFNIKVLFTDNDRLDLPIYGGEVIGIAKVKEYKLPHTKPVIEKLSENRIFTVVFTSGTTGSPKAIALRQESIEKTILTAVKFLEFSHEDKNICFLPLHIFTSRMYLYSAFLLCFNTVVTIPELVVSALRIYRPTIMQGVPYYFENIAALFHMRIQSRFDAKILYWIYRLSKKVKLSAISNKLHNKIFRALKDSFGGRMRFLITGTAPISKSTLKLYEEARINLFESYGLNETGVLTVNYSGHCKLGSVGKILPHYRIKISEEMQILVKSDFFWSSGYIDEVNKHSFRRNAEGYYETGDTGYIDENGYLFITGRCVDTLTLKNGYKINPQEIEKRLNELPVVKQSLVYTKDQKQLQAIIVKQSFKISKADVTKEIDTINQHLMMNERIREFICIDEEFTVENNFLTIHLKLNRKDILEKFAEKS